MNSFTATSAEVDSARADLLKYGFLYQTVGGFQVQLTAAWAGTPEAGWHQAEACNHTCLVHLPDGTLTGGEYPCGASFALETNKGIKRESFAPASVWISRLQKATLGLRLFNEEFLRTHLSPLCKRMKIPELQELAIRSQLGRPDSMIDGNMFGGEILLYPELGEVTRWANLNDVLPYWTTTGRAIMTEWLGPKDKWFYLKMLQVPATSPRVLAMSFDQASADELEHLVGLSIEKLYDEWSKVPKTFGQRQKVFEAIAATKVIKEMDLPIITFYNVVLHRGNISHVQRMYDIVTGPLDSTFNPFFGQCSFDPENGFDVGNVLWQADDLPAIADTVKWATDRHLGGNSRIPKRLHAWNLLQAQLNVWQNEPQRLLRAFSGYDVWRCYEDVGAARYVQIGIKREGDKLVNISSGVDASQTPWKLGQLPGNFLSCYWAPSSVGDIRSIDQSNPRQVAGYFSRIVEIGHNKPPAQKCPGCIMTRLMHDVLSTYAGIPQEFPELLEETIRLRQKAVNW